MGSQGHLAQGAGSLETQGQLGGWEAMLLCS